MISYNTLIEQLNVSVKNIETLAKQHNKPLEYMQKQLKTGIAVEGEHSKDHNTAEKIALAHLGEKHDYYIKLRKYVE